MALALVEHLNLTEDTTAAVTRPFLNYLQQKSTKAEPTLSRNSPFSAELCVFIQNRMEDNS